MTEAPTSRCVMCRAVRPPKCEASHLGSSPPGAPTQRGLSMLSTSESGRMNRADYQGRRCDGLLMESIALLIVSVRDRRTFRAALQDVPPSSE